jgi:two-component system cell cycle sensor histidine kinase/response regulator CckA
MFRPRDPYGLRLISGKFDRLPPWIRPYAIVLSALVAAFAVATTLLHTIGPKATVIVTLLADTLFLGAAWLGYGPGVLICSLILFAVPPLLLPGRPNHVEPGRFALLIFISLLVSRIGASKRKSESMLRKWGEELEVRVAERTAELERNQRSLAWLAAIVQSSDDAIVGETLEGTITSWNAGAEALFGYAPEETIGRSIAMLLPPNSREGIHATLRRIGEGEAIHRAESVGIRKDGGLIVISLTLSPIKDTSGAIIGVSSVARDMTAQRAASVALEHSEQRYRLLFENNPQPMWVYDQETLEFLTVNDTAVQSYGYSQQDFLRMTLKDIRLEEDVPKLLTATAVSPPGFNGEGSWRHRKKDGKVISVEITERPILFEGRPACLVMATDVTDRLALEEQFRQAQRLESVGRLAGGVAHDFNNLLTVINGYSEMLLRKTPARSDDALNEIRAAGERAAELTKQLLAFSRQQVIQPSVININAVVRSTETFLRRLIGEDIRMLTRLSSDLGLVLTDPGQMQQIIMNLAVNSRDAMPNGGTLLIETGNVTLDESYEAEHPTVRPGPYVLLAITDSGTGMTPEVRARIFEPFFTTKEMGKGTGLGLATVYGMVKQAGGWIWVYSEPGRGTTFKIYLPRTDKPLSVVESPSVREVRGNETIVLVEDQKEVRALAIKGLERFGYSVHGFGTAAEALSFCSEFPGDIHLVVTDVVMPDMNGRELASQISRLRPTARILFMSGYTTNVVVHHGVLDENVQFLQKPFTPDSLARKVREVLGNSADAQSGGLTE